MLEPAASLVTLAFTLALSGLPPVVPAAAPAMAPGPLLLRLEPVKIPAAQLQAAVDTWRRGCAGALGGRLPDLVLAGPGVPVTVKRWPDSSSRNGRCGQTTRKLVNGRLVAASIEIFARQNDGTPCFPLSDELAHEIGHVLGLDDSHWGVPGSIMGPRLRGHRREVSGEECAAAGVLTAPQPAWPQVAFELPAIPGLSMLEAPRNAQVTARTFLHRRPRAPGASRAPQLTPLRRPRSAGPTRSPARGRRSRAAVA